MCRCLERAAIRVGVAVSPQGVVVGFWKCFQSISRVEKPLRRQKIGKIGYYGHIIGSFKKFSRAQMGVVTAHVPKNILFTSSAFFIIQTLYKLSTSSQTCKLICRYFRLTDLTNRINEHLRNFNNNTITHYFASNTQTP